jgi:pimeloyl-ACP methyl ester carboxylesterase
VVNHTRWPYLTTNFVLLSRYLFIGIPQPTEHFDSDQRHTAMAPTGTLFVLLFAISGLMVYPAKSEAFIRTPKPAIIFVPAAFSRATVYDHVKSKLYDTGYDVVTVDLPSVGDAAEHVDRTADIKVVQEALRRQIHHDQKVILVGNSYGCTVICDALKDFENEAAVSGAADGKIMGVIFVSICGLLGTIPAQSPPEG